MRIPFALLGFGLTLGACTPEVRDPSPALPPPSVLETANIEIGIDGRCFTSFAISQDVFETVVEQVEVVPAVRDAQGRITAPAVFRNQDVRRLVAPSERGRFETLCPPQFTSEFTANLQRALAARQSYVGPVTGVYDARTGDAVRLYQLRHPPSDGQVVNSEVIAIDVARALGLVPLSQAQIADLNQQ